MLQMCGTIWLAEFPQSLLAEEPQEQALEERFRIFIW
jgi:hypothetical protein